jgi:cytochrome c oxidase cbb3-type subunit I/II
LEYTAPIHFKVKGKVKNLDKKSEKMSVLYFDERSFVPVEKREIVALIAYLQRLGTDIKTTEVKTASNN